MPALDARAAPAHHRRMPRSPLAPLLSAALLAGLVLASPRPALAQATQGGAPPYEAELLHLAEILGALHYLRPLCGAAEATRWRDEMQAMLDIEAPSGDRRGQFTSAFNTGYESYRQVYRVCTPSAELASQRYLETGAKLARDVATRYGSN